MPIQNSIMIISDPATENDAINNFCAILTYSGLLNGDQNGTADGSPENNADEWSRPGERDPVRLAQKVKWESGKAVKR